MIIQFTQVDSVKVGRFSGPVIAQHSHVLGLQLRASIKGAKTRILLDLSGVEKIDSTVVGLFLKIWLEVKQVRGRLLLLNPRKQPLRLLKGLKLLEHFPIEYERRRAFKRLRR